MNEVGRETPLPLALPDSAPGGGLVHAAGGALAHDRLGEVRMKGMVFAHTAVKRDDHCLVRSHGFCWMRLSKPALLRISHQAFARLSSADRSGMEVAASGQLHLGQFTILSLTTVRTKPQ